MIKNVALSPKITKKCEDTPMSYTTRELKSCQLRFPPFFHSASTFKRGAQAEQCYVCQGAQASLSSGLKNSNLKPVVVKKYIIAVDFKKVNHWLGLSQNNPGVLHEVPKESLQWFFFQPVFFHIDAPVVNFIKAYYFF